MPRIIHFEIPSDNPERATKFYGDVFGWQSNKWGGPTDYWLVSTGPKTEPGIDGGILKRPHPGATVVNTVDVPDLDQYVTSVQAKGGKLTVPKMAIPGVGWLAYCTDTEDNTFGMMQADTNAK
jgi:predicted enzyme related to lactoylglutathione lyase